MQIPLVVIVLLVIWFILIYNRIVSLKNQADQSWADVDVELRRRHDLVGNLVEAVRGYAGHERETLDAVTEARSRAVALREEGGPDGRAGRGAAEGALAAALRQLLAVAEQYPNLKANENFLALQASLEELERAIESARRRFNLRVRRFNVFVEQFPNNLVAGTVGAASRDYFGAEGDHREPPGVRFR
ncbi:MAG: LemA family protein [Candidatus Krumholzibacteriota bacterium]|nr:LemA family protein [Candidatus Krumholzibacteriota bacterium]